MKQLVQFRDHSLNQRRDRQGIVHAGLRIAHAYLKRVEKWVQPDVPPDFFSVIDATGFHQKLAVILILRERLERIRDAGARKTLEHLQAITL